jgi:hypothetical protein
MPRSAKLYIAFVLTSGMALPAGLVKWHFPDHARFLSYLALAMLAATLKVRLPKLHGTISVNFVFILIAVTQLTLAETLVVGCSATLIQCMWRTRTRPKPFQVLFNVAAMAVSIWLAYTTAHLLARHQELLVRVALSACVLFVANTGLVSLVLALVSPQPFKNVWVQCYLWTLPYYLVGAALAAVVDLSGRVVGWKPSLLVLPVMYLVYWYYRLYVARPSEQAPAPGT